MPRPSTTQQAQKPAQESQLIDLYEHPGHLLRRAQQISVSIFLDELGGDITPVQYAILRTLSNHPGIDQVTLAGLVGIDTSTGATVCVRLEEKGLLMRKVIPHNRRQRALNITPAGEQMLSDLIPAAQRLRKRLLSPLEADEQEQFMQLLDKLVRGNNTESRAPLASIKPVSSSDSNDDNK
ncbi:MarR family winged helix-turn-helix transcriptional regulator [Herbaspirillum rhizosphaerae]|uniref:MarR family winged helix-turn-helix transcriptional regulator n=1 Tax=Herbaspirillum rhizosphaerae TaxID=346179 RepID=UPI00067C0405|nr:MarR family transcriptional regulator [Herbaspirillum rhizosphaerae]